MSNTGERKNANKPRWRNFPLFLVEPLIHVGAAAEKHPDNPTGKYDTYNFLKGMKVDDCLDCAKRHLMKAESPYHGDLDDEFPPEKQVYHLAECAWNCLVALHNIKNRPDLDDRYKKRVQSTKELVKEDIKASDLFVAAEKAQEAIAQMVKSNKQTVFSPPKARAVKFDPGDVVKHVNNDVEVTVEGMYFDIHDRPILFVKDSEGKVFGVDPDFYKSIYKEKES